MVAARVGSGRSMRKTINPGARIENLVIGAPFEFDIIQNGA